MRSILRSVAGLLALLTLGVLLVPSRVVSQAPALLFGSYSNAAKAVTVSSAGYLNISFAGGPVNTGTSSFSITRQEPTPVAPTVAQVLDMTGVCTAGTHKFAVGVNTGTGHSITSAASAAVTCDASNTKVTVTIPTGVAAYATSRDIYASKANTSSPLFLVSTSPVVNDNSTTTYTFNLADASLTATVAPTTNTTADVILGFANTGQWTVNGSACATGSVVQGGTPTTCTTTPTLTSVLLSQLNLTTTPTDGAVLANTTNATGGATVQMAPRLRFRGNAWDTAMTETVDFSLEALPASAATPTGTFKLGFSLNGAAYTYPFTITSAGTAVFAGSVTSTASGFAAANGANIGWTGGSKLKTAVDGILNVTQSSGATLGLQFNIGTASPTVANCSVGTTGAPAAHSNNTAGEIVPGTGSTSCDVVFGAPAYSFAPFCTISDETTLGGGKITARSTTGFTVSNLTAGDTFSYHCFGGSV